MDGLPSTMSSASSYPGMESMARACPLNPVVKANPADQPTSPTIGSASAAVDQTSPHPLHLGTRHERNVAHRSRFS
jgi:hypothetical protein